MTEADGYFVDIPDNAPSYRPPLEPDIRAADELVACERQRDQWKAQAQLYLTELEDAEVELGAAKRLVAILILSAGGRVSVPDSMYNEVSDDTTLARWYDQATSCTVFEVRP